jgi:nucleoside-diphosphate-sugar epimerase
MDYRNWPSAAPNVIDVNVAGLTRFAETARLAGVRHFIFASSASIYRPSFEPLNEESPVLARDIYSLSKQFGEELLKLYEEYFVVTSLRLFALYGPGQRQRMFPNIVTRVLRGEPVDLQPRTRGEERPTGLTITPIHVADAAEVVCGLMERPFRGAINVASPEAVSVRRLAEDAGTMVGKPPVFRVDEKPRPGDLIADIRRLRDLVPMTFRPFGDGLRDVVEDLADRNPIVG